MTETQSAICPFHLAFPVSDLEETREFYVNVLGCREGRHSAVSIDFDLLGHQIVAHKVDKPDTKEAKNLVDDRPVPIPHFGVVLPWERWHSLADRLKQLGVEFEIEPHVRFADRLGEQASLFIRDPSGNPIEFKSFEDPSQMFATG